MSSQLRINAFNNEISILGSIGIKAGIPLDFITELLVDFD